MPVADSTWRAALAFSVAAACRSAAAQSVWTGAGGDNQWGNPNNWNPVGVPSGAAVVQAAQQRVSIGAANFASLTATAPIAFTGSAVYQSVVGTDTNIAAGGFSIGPALPGGVMSFTGVGDWSSGTIQNTAVRVETGAVLTLSPAPSGQRSVQTGSLSNYGTVRLSANLRPVGSTVTNHGRLEFLAPTSIEQTTPSGQFVNRGLVVVNLQSLEQARLPLDVANSGELRLIGGNLSLGPSTHSAGASASVASGASLILSGLTHTVNGGTSWSGDGSALLQSGSLLIDSATLTTSLDPSGTHFGGLSLMASSNGWAVDALGGGMLHNTGVVDWYSGTIRGSDEFTTTVRNDGSFRIRASNGLVQRALIRNTDRLVIELGNNGFRLNQAFIVNEIGGEVEWLAGTISRDGATPIGMSTVLENSGLISVSGTAPHRLGVMLDGRPGSRIAVDSGSLVFESAGTPHVSRGAEFAASVDTEFLLNAQLDVTSSTPTSLTGSGAFRVDSGGAFLNIHPGSLLQSNMIVGGVQLVNGRIGGGGAFQNAGTIRAVGGTLGSASGNSDGTLIVNGGLFEIPIGNVRLAGLLVNNPGSEAVVIINGNIQPAPGAVINNQGVLVVGDFLTISSSGAGAPAAQLVNQQSGTVRKVDPGPSTVAMAVDNSGLVRVEQGALSISGPVVQLVPIAGSPAGYNLVGGSWHVEPGATLQFNNRSVRRLGGTCSFKVSGACPDLVANEVTDNATLEIGALFNPDDSIVIRGEGRAVVDSTIGPGSNDRFGVADNGSLSGRGTINRPVDVQGNGSVQPGRSPGVLSVGSLNMTGGSVEIELAGTSPGTQHDVLAVQGQATLAGTLRVALIGGFVPRAGQQFDVLTAASLTGQFSSVIAPALPGGGRLRAVYLPGLVRITASACSADVAVLGGVPGSDLMLTADDVVVFLAGFFAGDAAIADVAMLGGAPNPDGLLTADDLVWFLAAFFGGCA